MRKRTIMNIWNLEEVNVRSSMGWQDVHVDFFFLWVTPTSIYKLFYLLYNFDSVSHIHVWTWTPLIPTHSVIWYYFWFPFCMFLQLQVILFSYRCPFQFFLTIFCNFTYQSQFSLPLYTSCPYFLSHTTPSTTQRG